MDRTKEYTKYIIRSSFILNPLPENEYNTVVLMPRSRSWQCTGGVVVTQSVEVCWKRWTWNW